ncbi:MAG: hypothetical protein U5K79_08930 [Cyclobacteriaceae bacterium]|nr:hypothetical protein [Cyclobacteriaceae bacterium]
MTVNEKNILNELFKSWCGTDATAITTIPQSGSYRQYFRLTANGITAIGVSNEDVKENNAFLTFTRHFNSLKLQFLRYISNIRTKNNISFPTLVICRFLIFSSHEENRSAYFPDRLYRYIKQTLSKELPEFQIQASRGLDYSVCYPPCCFCQAIHDAGMLSYFKYLLLKSAEIPFDEQLRWKMSFLGFHRIPTASD